MPRVLEPAEWMPACGPSGQLFGEPPEPMLKFLQPKTLPWQRERPGLTILDVCKYRIEDGVKLKHGTAEMNVKGRPPRPRSAVVLRSDIANANVHPKPLSADKPEAVYLVHCDSTETTCATLPTHPPSAHATSHAATASKPCLAGISHI